MVDDNVDVEVGDSFDKCNNQIIPKCKRTSSSWRGVSGSGSGREYDIRTIRRITPSSLATNSP